MALAMTIMAIMMMAMTIIAIMMMAMRMMTMMRMAMMMMMMAIKRIGSWSGKCSREMGWLPVMEPRNGDGQASQHHHWESSFIIIIGDDRGWSLEMKMAGQGTSAGSWSWCWWSIWSKCEEDDVDDCDASQACNGVRFSSKSSLLKVKLYQKCSPNIAIFANIANIACVKIHQLNLSRFKVIL